VRTPRAKPRLLPAALLAVAGVASAAVAGQDFPSQPVRIVVVYPPGGGIDLVARHLARRLGEEWGVPVVVENRPGAGTTLGTRAVARAAPDGYTLLMTDVSLAIAPSLYRSLPYDTRRDLAPVSLVNLVADVLVVNPEVPATSVRELIDLARRQPRGLTYASAGNGTLNHLAPELLKSMTGVDMVHVPYKGALAALNDVVAGRGQVYIGALASAVPQVKAGRLRALAVTGARRSAVLPDLPTMAEAGVPGYDVNAWYGLLAPGGTPAGVVERIQRDVARIGREPAFERMLAVDGSEPVLGTPAEFSAFLDREIEKWRRAVLDAGAVVD